MLVLAIIGTGGVFTGTNPAYTTHELSHHLKTSQARFLITEPEMLRNVVEAAKALNVPEKNILIFNTMNQPIPQGFRSWESLLQHGEQDWVRFDDEEKSKRTTAGRFFSSGTTGLPKAAVISHYNLVAQHTLVYEINEPKPYDVSFTIQIR
jgi:acyl-CoA synthetase (AMP-forming)/AMP-acid ligase II